MEYQVEEINYLKGGSGGGKFLKLNEKKKESRARKVFGEDFQMVQRMKKSDILF